MTQQKNKQCVPHDNDCHCAKAEGVPRISLQFQTFIMKAVDKIC